MKNNINDIFIEKILSNKDKYKKDYKDMSLGVKNSEAIYNGEPVPFLYQPKFFTKEILEDLKNITNTTTAIFLKIINRYIRDKEYREAFNFPKEIEELILIEPHISFPFPIARYDLFYRGIGDFTFCEINTDGTSAMNEDRALCEEFKKTQIFKDLSLDYDLSGFELFSTWAKKIKEFYNQKFEGDPVIAILDINASKQNLEFKRFASSFENIGMKTFIVSPEDLECREGILYFNDIKIDLVYRRLVTSDFYKNIDLMSHIVEAIKCSNTVFVGPLQSQIIHNKILFKVLHQEEYYDIFTESEINFIKSHIPYTKLLTINESKKKKYIDNKEKYILKPLDSYASKGVFAGKDYDLSSWSKILAKSAESPYLIQEYADIPVTKMIDFESENYLDYFNNITGVFVYEGKLAGFYSRVGKNSLISGVHGGYTLASLKAKCK